MKKKLLFILQSFEIGGTTVSVRNLISVLNTKRYDVSIWVMDDRGSLDWMYKDIAQLPTNIVAKSLALNGWRDADGFFKRLLAALIRLFAKKQITNRIIYNYAVKKSIGHMCFDTVIAGQEGLTTQIAAIIPGNNHVAWVRCDYKRVFQARGGKKETIYNQYDHIVCVAEKTRDNFAEIYPSLDERTLCIYNPQDSNLIVSSAETDDHDHRFQRESGKVIVSLGRLDSVKRFDRIPEIARELVKQGLCFKWFIIGDGGEKQRIEEEIKKNNIQENVIMLGAKSNPHFYIKKADLYVCLSSSEACPRVINEAKILGTPVVSTDFPSVYEYLEDGVNGRIVPLDHITNAIYELLTDGFLYQRIKKEIDNFTFDNSPLVEKLEQIL